MASHGLSPRGRGNRGGLRIAPVLYGSIPAWAGEPGRRTLEDPGSRVYPRVGGGTSVPDASLIGEGLSPRGRGNRIRTIRKARKRRSIPAWAGEPPTPTPN